MFSLLSFLLLSFHLNASTGIECNRKWFGGESVVCVCNTDQCDDFILPQVHRGSALIVESSKAGKRFAIRSTRFSCKNVQPKSSSVQTLDLVVKTGKKYQKVFGFGGAFTDSASLNILSLSPPLSKELLKGYFGQSGIEYNMARIPIGGTDMSTRAYALDDVEGDFDLRHFALAEEDLNSKIPLIKMAKAMTKDDLWLFAAPWSPPAWMKTNQMLNGSSFLLGEVGGKYYETYANYIVKFIQEYGKRDVHFWGLSPQNEPLSSFTPFTKFNVLGLSGVMEKDFIKLNLGPALRKAGYQSLKLMIYDYNIGNISQYSRTVLEDREAADYVSGIALHWYQRYLDIYEELDTLKEEFPDQFILSTEACQSHYSRFVTLGSWKRGEDYAKDIIQNLNHGVTGWVDWNLALNEEGGPSWAENYLDSAVIVNSTGNEFYRNPMFYVMGHFSKFVKRNSVRLDVQVQGRPEDIQVVSFLTPSYEVVLIAMNPLEEDFNLRIADDLQHNLLLTLEARSILSLIYKV